MFIHRRQVPIPIDWILNRLQKIRKSLQIHRKNHDEKIIGNSCFHISSVVQFNDIHTFFLFSLITAIKQNTLCTLINCMLKNYEITMNKQKQITFHLCFWAKINLIKSCVGRKNAYKHTFTYKVSTNNLHRKTTCQIKKQNFLLEQKGFYNTVVQKPL